MDLVSGTMLETSKGECNVTGGITISCNALIEQRFKLHPLVFESKPFFLWSS